MDKIEVLKVSSEEELKKVYQIRTTVFVEEQNCPPELEWENEDVSTHFLAKLNDQPAGACRWRETEKGFKLERFAVLPQFRGKGIASKMIATLLADLPQNADYVYLHAQVTAMPLYQLANFKAVGHMFEEAGIQHYKMVLDN
ncbi:GNAT family acetyltransferase [Pedobacter psychrophilus]|uniref:GNAT family acetyltransferase n=1 Tax=Pedobacter psychrophilus TaxID=1826909 RepID=A0A179DN41_9SPHI|nr:GNAT family N-acetyltransferase [Pedobacter psychrophilus]OAQ42354.1 GNAT family acetyltransferase [Pedobacter psychrophilus]